MAAERHRRIGVVGRVSAAPASGWNVAPATVHIRPNATFLHEEVVLGGVGHPTGVDADTDDRCSIDLAAVCSWNVSGGIPADI